MNDPLLVSGGDGVRKRNGDVEKRVQGEPLPGQKFGEVILSAAAGAP